ncbi:MAG TPA: carbohydrate binding domain-containing protein, partial [Polyangiaceae bacterium]|nr:carbohydrate binding domain-containing protein [Polyangiaceae bacterium]
MRRYRTSTVVAPFWAGALALSGAVVGCGRPASPAGGTRAPAGEAAARGAAPAGHNLIWKATFEDGKWMPWWTHYEPPAEGVAGVKDGYFCFTVTAKGGGPWDTEFHHGHMVIQKGHAYAISFKI